MSFTEQCKQIKLHLEHAKTKHPFFANSITSPMPMKILEECSMKTAIILHRRNRKILDMWKSFASKRKAAIKISPSFDNIMHAELYEIYAAFAKGDIKQARYEVYDVVAVLLRLDEELETLWENQCNNGLYIPDEQ